LRFPHWSDETEALPRQCFDQALFVAGIADRAPDGIQARRQRRIGHAAPVPDGVDEVVLADDALPVVETGAADWSISMHSFYEFAFAYSLSAIWRPQQALRHDDLSLKSPPAGTLVAL
jgi:hypothetical protein